MGPTRRPAGDDAAPGEYLRTMDPDQSDEFVDWVADETLLTADQASLPAAVGRPEAIPPSRTRARVVAIGATLTGVTLIAGVALIGLGVVEMLASGVGLLAVVALAIGVALTSTHWGWVHVAEATADSIEKRRTSEITARRRQWLATIKPYTHYEVTTDVSDDGSITITRFRHRPIRSGEHSFKFERQTDHVEVHGGDESAAAIAERAELLRRQAAIDTDFERERFDLAADAYQTTLLERSDKRERLDALRAASAALSEQINSNLRDPPLAE